MLSNTILLAYLLIATVTDVRWRKIYNWTPYSAFLVAILINSIRSVSDIFAGESNPESLDWHGTIGIGWCLLGFLACGGLMLVCYVFFAGGVGGGDVKLIAMIGAFVGIERGFEVMLWTFVLGACLAIIVLIWQYGFWRLVMRICKYILYAIRLGGRFPLTAEEREPLQKHKLFLAPSALVGTLIVQFNLIQFM